MPLSGLESCLSIWVAVCGFWRQCLCSSLTLLFRSVICCLCFCASLVLVFRSGVCCRCPYSSLIRVFRLCELRRSGVCALLALIFPAGCCIGLRRLYGARLLFIMSDAQLDAMFPPSVLENMVYFPTEYDNPQPICCIC